MSKTKEHRIRVQEDRNETLDLEYRMKKLEEESELIAEGMANFATTMADKIIDINKNLKSILKHLSDGSI